jgi:hypothetical protein
MDIREFIISGHSEDIEDTFIVPRNMTIIFYAGNNQTCNVDYSEDSLQQSIIFMRSGNYETYEGGSVCKNYNIEFGTEPYQGLAEIVNDTFRFIDITNGNILSQICKQIQRIYGPSKKYIVYCCFCRGSKKEYEGMDFGSFNSLDNIDFSGYMDGGRRRRHSRRRRRSKTRKHNKHVKTRKYKRGGNTSSSSDDSGINETWRDTVVGEPAFRERLSTLVTTMPNKGHVGSYLRAVCSSNGYCMALGKNRKLIYKYFDGFANFKYAITPFSLLSSGGNGKVYEVYYRRLDYRAVCTLKYSLKPKADSIFYEAYVGFSYINKLTKYFTLFLETYGCYWIENTLLLDELHEHSPFSVNTIDSLTGLIKNNDVKIINPLKLNKLRKTACKDPLRVMVLTEYVENATDFADIVKKYRFTPKFKLFEHGLPAMLYQIYSVLSVISHNFTHYDLHGGNCIVYTIPDNRYVRMIYHHPSGQTIEFNTGFIVKLIDYGRCYVPTSRQFHDTVAATPECLVSGDSVPGESFGFGMFEEYPLRQYHYVTPKLNNYSADLRLLFDVSKAYDKDTNFRRLLRRVQFAERFGTFKISPNEPNPDNKIRNVMEAERALAGFINDPSFTNVDTAFANGKTKIGDIHIYLDMSKPMEFITV